MLVRIKKGRTSAERSLHKIFYSSHEFCHKNSKNAPKISPTFLSLYFVGQKKSRKTPAATRFCRHAGRRIHFSKVTFSVSGKVIFELLGPVLGRTDFSRIFFATGFFSRILSLDFSPHFYGEKGHRKNPPGKSPAKSSKMSTSNERPTQ